MKKTSLTLEDFKKNELPKKHYKMIMGGDEPIIDPNTDPKIIANIIPPGTVRPPGQT
ncbi:hypothetical protein [Flavobacterium sp. KMS]|jgi:hypothetical protein|uniref:hypothetical protein n=1 Tax=unclassified Flavobacterium TaxID=196869 RepID=UPI000A7FF3B5|nr:hypothetical protein [Flavobacterium sp. KMS]